MSIYTQTACFDGTARALTEDEMRKIAPSIFATEAHESRSDRFRAIATIDVLRALSNEGFSPVGVRQSTTRDDSKKEFTKHLIRLRRLDDAKSHQVGDTVCEMLLKNANDGTSAYDLMAGLFRVLCQNSMVAQSGTIDSAKVRHSGDVIAKTIEGTYRVIGEAQKALAAPADWSALRLNRDEAIVLAEAAHLVRFGDAEGNVATPVKPEQLLAPRRAGDTGADLWTAFNVVQENVIRGGVTAEFVGANGERRRTTTRQIKGIDQDVRLNKALWLIGERLAHLKRAA